MTDGPGWIRSAASQLPGALQLGRFVRRSLVPRARTAHALSSAYGDELFQPYPDTCENRYPELFDRLAELLRDRADARILSFGCSTGEEVRALRQRLPAARIVGIDLNPDAIAAARNNDPQHRDDYRVAGRPEPEERFDAVLALAVFRHGQLERYRPDSCASTMTFSRFADGVSRLDAALIEGGYLAIYNSHFRFTDTHLAPRYAVDPLRLSGHPSQELAYGPDNRRIGGQANPPVLFRKMA